jgi:drug/metabolite transporter (DMT)-like permease
MFEMLPIVNRTGFRTKLRTAVAAIDFVFGFFLLFGGGNLAYHEESAYPGANQAMGIAFMLLGTALFFSALRVVRKGKAGFRPFVYVVLAATSSGFFVYQYVKHNPPVSRQDTVAWIVILAVVAACVSLQRVLRPQGESSQEPQRELKSK